MKLIFNQILETIGKGNSNWELINAIALTVLAVAYILFIGSLFQLDVYTFEDRITYHEYIEPVFSISEELYSIFIIAPFLCWLLISFIHYRKIQNRKIVTILSILFIVQIAIWSLFLNGLLQIISLSTLPLVLAYYITVFRKGSAFVASTLTLVLHYILILISVLALYSMIITIFNLDQKDYFQQVFILLSRSNPAIIFLLVFSFFMKIIFQHLHVARIFGRQNINYTITKVSFPRTSNLIYLTCFSLLSIILIFVPHLFNAIESGSFHAIVGVDTQYYIDGIEKLDSSENINEFAHELFFLSPFKPGDRPLSLLLVFLSTKILPIQPVIAVEYLIPFILGSSLVVVTFLLSREITSNDWIAIFSSFVAAVSFQVLIGVYAGLLANWLALVIGYLSLLYLLRYVRGLGWRNVLIFSVLLILTLYSHSYTYSFLIVFITLFVLLCFGLRIYGRKLLCIVLVVVAASILVDISRGVADSSFASIQNNLQIIEVQGAGASQYSQRWSNLVHTIQVHLGSGYSNFTILSLAFVGVFILSYRNIPGVILYAIFSIGILGLLFGNKVLIGRLLYEMPFQIPVAISVYFINERLCWPSNRIFVIAVSLSLFASAFKHLSNYGTFTPEFGSSSG